MPQPVIIVKEGLFYLEGEALLVQEADGTTEDVEALLAEVRGRSVDVSVHHFPPKPPLLHEPGFGCCLWSGHCPAGHQEDPAWLFSMSAQGVLELSPAGTCLIGGREIPLRTKMVGHQGRLVLFASGEVSSSATPDDLLGEAEDLLNLVQDLRDSLKRD